MVPNGAIVERDTAVDLRDFKVVSLLLRNPDFTTAKHIADAINLDFHKTVASAIDSTRVDVGVADAGESSVPDLISRVQNLSLTIQPPARVIVNERTGTIVLGGDVKLTPVSVIHGGLSIEVTTSYAVAPVPGGVATYIPGGGAGPAGRAGPGGPKPGEGAPGGTSGPGVNNSNGGLVIPSQPDALVPETNVTADDSQAKSMKLDDGANVEELVNGLHAIGTNAQDVVAILQAIKAAGGLQADLEVQ
jgi:flagellar P-ring protein precursor FlgI